MEETLTLADRYLMLGLKLKGNGQLRCMFCGVHARVGSDGTPVITHRTYCVVVECYVRKENIDGNESVDAKGG
jgi:hypothetical protein